MYLIKYINYTKHNKSNCIGENGRGKQMKLLISKNNFLLNWYQSDYDIMETTLTFCKYFPQYKIVSKENSVLGAIYSE